MTVRQATIADLELLVPLFDGYRRFYGRASEPESVRQFLHERFAHSQSVIFVAEDEGRAIGFTQLYPSFSSVRLKRIFVLNDLFVDPDARGCGAGVALLDAAAQFGRAVGAARLVLSTGVGNSVAQALYERCGWKRDREFVTYELDLV